MKDEIKRSCIDCGVTNCNLEDKTYPAFCVGESFSETALEEVKELYKQEQNHKAMVAAAEVEFEGYCRLTRVEEIMEFAKKIGAKKIGIATCVGLIREASTFAKILRAHGFDVFGIGCKAGAIKKVSVGIPEKCTAIGENICNPIMQAKRLNKENTDLNVVVGLCVGHDSLFYKYADALTTTLITKDRVLGHNPAAAIYNAQSYYKRLLK